MNVVKAGLATVAVAVLSTGAAAQGARGPIELNMLRPPMKTVTNTEAGLAPVPANAVSIVVTFNANVPVGHQTFFTTAAATWMTRIPSYKAGVTGPTTITISASEPAIDGVGGILGSAGPSATTITGGFRFTTTGSMSFDSADVANLIAASSYDDVIEHEMGHVLGIGTLWTNQPTPLYVTGTGQYTGASGLAAWKTRFSGQSAATFVPVELGGGSGTANGHWNEVDGGSGPTGITELSSGIDMRFEEMTGWLNAPVNYSAVTHLGMADLGYAPAAGAPVELLELSIE